MDWGAEGLAPLLTHGWLSRLPRHLQAALLKATRVRRIASGEVLFSVGDPPGGLYGLASGCLAIEAAQSDSAPHKSFLVHPGTWLGEGPTAGLDNRLIGVWATRPSVVAVIEIAGFRRAAARMPELWRHLALLALEGNARTIGLAQDLMQRGSRARLAALLARLAGLREAYPPVPPVIDATQGEIAAIANLSRSVVSTLLMRLQQEGIIRLHRASIEVLDARRLLDAIAPSPGAAPRHAPTLEAGNSR